MLLRLGWQGSCVRGAKREVGRIMFIARISSQAVCLGLGVWAVCKQGSPWAAGFGRLFADIDSHAWPVAVGEDVLVLWDLAQLRWI